MHASFRTPPHLAFAMALLVVLSDAVAATVLLRDDVLDAEVKVFEGTVPRHLYHWVAPEVLLGLVRNGYEGGPYPRLGSVGGRFSTYFPQFKQAPASADRGALFTWIHPETATRGGPYELYGEVLVRFDIEVDPTRVLHCRVGKYQEEYVGPGVRGDIPIADYDLVYHANNLREWIILDRSIIKGFTFRPDDLRPVLEDGLDHLKNDPLLTKRAHFDLLPFEWEPDGLIYDGGASTRNYPVFRIERFLRTGSTVVPTEFVDGSPSNLPVLAATIHAYRVDETRTMVRDLARGPIMQGRSIASLIGFFALRTALAMALADSPDQPTWYHTMVMTWLDELAAALHTHYEPMSTAAVDPTTIDATRAILADLERPFADTITAIELVLGPLPAELPSLGVRFASLRSVK